MGRRSTVPTTVALTIAALVLAPSPASAQSRATLSEWDKTRKKSVELIQASKYDEGTAELKRCLELLPDEPGVPYDLACVASIRSQLDASIEWLGKAIDHNLGLLSEKDLTHLEKGDNDLINVRKDARFAGLVERLKARRKAASDALTKPAIYVPEKLKDAESVPLLVVLHDRGETCVAALEKGPWKKVADELGFAVVAPSAACLAGADAAAGMRWFDLWTDYLKSPYVFEKGIPTALDLFKKTHKVDGARVYIAGMGEGGLMAFHVAASANGSYKGAVVWGATVLPADSVVKRAKIAANAGLKVALLEPAGSVYCPFADAKDVGPVLDALPKLMADCGLAATIEKIEAKPDQPDLAATRIAAALKSFAPAPEAPEEKKEDEKGDAEKDDDGGGGGR